MNNVEKALFEQMESDKFIAVVSDEFDFVDNLTDQRDLEKVEDKEAN